MGQLEEALIPLTSARARRRPPGARPARRCADPARRGRVPAARHVRLPDRPDGRAGRRVRRPGRPGGLRRRHRPSRRRRARAEHEGRPLEDRAATPRSTTTSLGRVGATRVPGLRDDHRRGRVVRDPPRRHGLRGARRRCPRSSCGPRRPPMPSSSSTGRRSTPRAAARSRDIGRPPRRRRRRSLFTVTDTQRTAGTQTAGLTVHRGRLHGTRRASARR